MTTTTTTTTTATTVVTATAIAIATATAAAITAPTGYYCSFRQAHNYRSKAYKAPPTNLKVLSIVQKRIFNNVRALIIRIGFWGLLIIAIV